MVFTDYVVEILNRKAELIIDTAGADVIWYIGVIEDHPSCIIDIEGSPDVRDFENGEQFLEHVQMYLDDGAYITKDVFNLYANHPAWAIEDPDPDVPPIGRL